MKSPDTTQTEPYASLDALRRANDELLSNLPEEEGPLFPASLEANEARIREFIDRAVATGALLDVPSDRRVAQGLIDYLAASTYATIGDQRKKEPMSGRSGILLKPFDDKLIDSAASRGDAFISSLSRKDQELARRILLRHVRLPEGSRTCISSLSPLETLSSVGDPEHVKNILTELEGRGIINVTRAAQGNFVELRYDSLMRRWPLLCNWVDQRVKFRDAAQFWLKSGKSRGALLTADLPEKAKAYADLNELEKAFISASRRHELRFAVVLAAVAVALLFALPAYHYGYGAYARLMFERYIKIAKASDNSVEIAEALRRIAGYQRHAQGLKNEEVPLSSAVLVGSTLEKINLRGLTARSLLLTNAKLYNVDLTDATLSTSSFIRADIINSVLTNAGLRFARFDESAIASSSFVNADLFLAVFDGAQLCGVNFSDANVRNASFWDVFFDETDPPNFRNSPWWSAVGWNKNQREILSEKFAKENPKNSRSFMRYLKEIDEELNRAPKGTTLRATLLNERAWVFATVGIDLGDAELNAREALQVYGALSSLARTRANVQDTLGYILMQKGNLEEAQRLLSDAVALTDDGEILFRYALTLSMRGNRDHATVNLKKSIGEQGYIPSHELYLLKGRISEQFLAEIDSASSERREQLAQEGRRNRVQTRSCPTGPSPSPTR
jgi:hypothetical protein